MADLETGYSTGKQPDAHGPSGQSYPDSSSGQRVDYSEEIDSSYAGTDQDEGWE